MRASALWGKGGRLALLALTVGLMLPAAFIAPAARADSAPANVPQQLLDQASSDPNAVFDVIVEGAQGTSTSAVTQTALAAINAKPVKQETIDQLAKAASDAAKKASDLDAKAVKAQADVAANPLDQGKADAAAKAQAAAVAADAATAKAQAALSQAQSSSAGASTAEINNSFSSVSAVAASLTGAQVLALAGDNSVAVLPDAPVTVSGIDNNQKWYETTQAKWYKGSPLFKSARDSTPTIAIIDSGVDPGAANLSGRFYGQVSLASLGPNSPGDGWGHGTMVASLAAGADDHYAGADPAAKILSLDVVNDAGQARTSDVIAAIDWVLQNASNYNIRVANLSLQESVQSSFLFDPLDKAVEKLWQSGIVVVTAAGNYAANGQPSGVLYAPANDPFVITVGAAEINNSGDPKDDTAAPWSAYGYTIDGFIKPELSAPGRYLIAGIPSASNLAATGGQNAKLVRQGFIQLSGSSFAAPMVSGAAAALLAAHPNWTPDQVKGALMLGASALPRATQWSLGVGELNLKRSLELKVDPPNPNLALESFLTSDPRGGSIPVFNVASWTAAAANASWSSASWSSASWSSASWSSASWSSASWSSASWSSASWSSASWSAASFLPPASGSAVADYAQLDGAGNG